jgi:hypothetical protein
VESDLQNDTIVPGYLLQFWSLQPVLSAKLFDGRFIKKKAARSGSTTDLILPGSATGMTAVFWVAGCYSIHCYLHFLLSISNVL